MTKADKSLLAIFCGRGIGELARSRGNRTLARLVGHEGGVGQEHRD